MIKFTSHILGSSKGYTLIELVLTISLLGILSLVAIPEDNNLVPISLEAAAQKTRADLRYAQNLATTTGEAHGFRVTSDSTYEVYNVTTGTVVNSAVNMPMQEDLSDDFGDAVFSKNTYQVEFDSNGTPTTGAGLVIQINDDSNNKQIQVSSNSGYVSIIN